MIKLLKYEYEVLTIPDNYPAIEEKELVSKAEAEGWEQVAVKGMTYYLRRPRILT